MQGQDPRSLRHAFGRFATGVTLVTTRGAGGRPEGMTVNSFASVSLDPPLLLWSIRREAASRAAFESSGHFAVHVLAEAQRGLAERFARPAPDGGGSRFEGLAWHPGRAGSPLLEGALARFECATEALHPGGDHVIMLGRVLAWELGEGEPLLFHAGRFRRAECERAAAE